MFLVVSSTIHPGTGEKIFAPFRVSAFVPANIIIAAGLLLPGASVCIYRLLESLNFSLFS